MSIQAQQMVPKVVSGRVERLAHFASQYVTPRHIDIWLPPGYSAQHKYAVIYMHDGQMLFDSAESWNKQSWDVDDVASQLLLEGKMQPCIIVGIWNAGKGRHADYFPQRPFDDLLPIQKDTVMAQLVRAGVSTQHFPNSDNYLKFIVTELKPYIDTTYAVYTDRSHTFIAGSSMGGLISLYAICEYPTVFGGAACLSTHWVGTFTLAHNPIPQSFMRYLGYKLPSPADHTIYFDCGDQTLDALYPHIQKQVDSLMRAKGYTSNSWVTKYFFGDDHTERSWHKRLHIPLSFLLAK